MNSDGIHQRLEKALEVVEIASRFLLEHENLRTSITSKAANDYVTAADKKCEELIEKNLSDAFPDDSFYGEEGGERGNSKDCWIIDPIDGTVNFMCDFPNYTISIAFRDEDGVKLGIVAVPRQKEVFYAVKGEGAFLNGSYIHTVENVDLSKTLALLVPPHRVHKYLDAYMIKMRRFYDCISDVRSIGSAALSLCYVASGRCSMYYEMGLHTYDMAAGALIVEEAGGSVTLINPDPDFIEIAASGSSYHVKMLEIIHG
mgnify:CR=1 FL=1